MYSASRYLPCASTASSHRAPGRAAATAAIPARPRGRGGRRAPPAANGGSTSGPCRRSRALAVDHDLRGAARPVRRRQEHAFLELHRVAEGVEGPHLAVGQQQDDAVAVRRAGWPSPPDAGGSAWRTRPPRAWEARGPRRRRSCPRRRGCARPGSAAPRACARWRIRARSRRAKRAAIRPRLACRAPAARGAGRRRWECRTAACAGAMASRKRHDEVSLKVTVECAGVARATCRQFSLFTAGRPQLTTSRCWRHDSSNDRQPACASWLTDKGGGRPVSITSALSPASMR